jgi:DNA-binding beta-propeller fold protein YncE|tara:strand:- start:15051 stop:16277 length:1227 start_codon:yes stop_codon:yes gene_type:complete
MNTMQWNLQRILKATAFCLTAACLMLGSSYVVADEKGDKKGDDKKEVKKEEPKKEAPKKEEPKKEEPKKETKPAPKKEEPKKEEPKKEEPKKPAVTVKTLVTNLESPSGIAIQDGTGHVFVASRYGVYRYDAKGKTVDLEIAGYPTDVYGKGPKYNIGPLGVAFMDKDHLVVGDGSRPDAEELVRIYKVGDKPLEKWVKEDTAVQTLGPIKAGDKSAKGEGNFYGVAVGDGAIYITCNGDDTKGWVAKSVIKDGKAGPLEPSIATKEATNVDAPVAITFSPDGKELVIGQMGEVNVAGDSLLTFYDPKTGKLTKSLKTGLSDIAGLAYSPKTKKLYATDFSWVDAAKGGLFELKIDGDKVTAEKVISLDKPAAIAFDKEGNLYLTVFGTQGKDPEKSPGSLAVIKAGL